MRKTQKLSQLAEEIIVCAIDVVGLYSNIPHDEGPTSLKEFLGNRVDKQVKTDSMRELTKLGLNSENVESDVKFDKQIRGTATGTKFAPYFLWQL